MYFRRKRIGDQRTTFPDRRRPRFCNKSVPNATCMSQAPQRSDTPKVHDAFHADELSAPRIQVRGLAPLAGAYW